MVFLRILKESIKLPQKKAMFTLNRVGMDIVVVYMFLLIFIVSLPAFIERVRSTHLLTVDIELFFLIIYFFIFYYLPLTIITFILLSGVAYVAVHFASWMGRRLHFSILWKMAAFSTTVPFLIYTVIAFFYPISNSVLWFSLLYTLILIIKIISVYPKVKTKKKL